MEDMRLQLINFCTMKIAGLFKKTHKIVVKYYFYAGGISTKPIFVHLGR